MVDPSPIFFISSSPASSATTTITSSFSSDISADEGDSETSLLLHRGREEEDAMTETKLHVGHGNDGDADSNSKIDASEDTAHQISSGISSPLLPNSVVMLYSWNDVFPGS